MRGTKKLLALVAAGVVVSCGSSKGPTPSATAVTGASAAPTTAAPTTAAPTTAAVTAAAPTTASPKATNAPKLTTATELLASIATPNADLPGWIRRPVADLKRTPSALADMAKQTAACAGISEWMPLPTGAAVSAAGVEFENQYDWLSQELVVMPDEASAKAAMNFYRTNPSIADCQAESLQGWLTNSFRNTVFDGRSPVLSAARPEFGDDQAIWDVTFDIVETGSKVVRSSSTVPAIRARFGRIIVYMGGRVAEPKVAPALAESARLITVGV